MQTFLPYPDFVQSAKCLDSKRLGKQRVEAMQILNTIERGTGWIHHPIVKMWTGYEDALKYYFDVVSMEWIKRGYQHNMHFYLISGFNGLVNPIYSICIDKIKKPDWIGFEPFHSSHRAALLAKDFNWYSQFGWTEKPEINYIWIK